MTNVPSQQQNSSSKWHPTNLKKIQQHAPEIVSWQKIYENENWTFKMCIGGACMGTGHPRPILNFAPCSKLFWIHICTVIRGHPQGNFEIWDSEMARARNGLEHRIILYILTAVFTKILKVSKHVFNGIFDLKWRGNHESHEDVAAKSPRYVWYSGFWNPVTRPFSANDSTNKTINFKIWNVLRKWKMRK